MEKLRYYKNELIQISSIIDIPEMQDILVFFDKMEQNKEIVGMENFNRIKDKSIIEILDLSSCNLKELPKNVSELKNIKVLDISDNTGIDIQNIKFLTSLKILFIENCKKVQLDDNIGYLNELLILSLDNNKLVDLPDSFQNLKMIFFLTLNYNNIKKIPDVLRYLDSLYDLRVENNKIEILDDQLILSKNLRLLSLYSNKISKIQTNSESFKQLYGLNLSNNQLISFEGLKSMTNLKVLRLIETKLTEIPPEIFKISTLKKLVLRKNKIQKINQEISHLRNLIRLDLSQNNLKNISDGLYDLNELVKLNLSFNDNIGSISDKIGRLSKLEILGLSSCGLEEFPIAITLLEGLKELDISLNYIEEVPKLIKKLSKLNYLDLAFCSLDTIPEEIYSLSNLEKLDLSENKLKSISSKINNLKKLKVFLIDYNKIEEYPLELSDLTRLNRIYIDEKHTNPLNNMPEAKNLGIIELMSYLNLKRGTGKYYTLCDIPDEFKTGFQQYLNFFFDFVVRLTGKEIVFNIEKVPNGLKLITESSSGLNIDKIDSFLTKYIKFLINSNELLIDNDYTPNQNLVEIHQLVIDLNYEKKNLLRKIEDQLEKILFSNKTVADTNTFIENLNFQIRFFNQKFSDLLLHISDYNIKGKSVKFNLSIEPDNNRKINPPNSFDPEEFLYVLIKKAMRMTEGKGVKMIEDIHNNEFAVFLREHHYFATDQTQSGISNKNFGELDIMIREIDGTPICIIEAFKLKSIGKNDKIASSHVNKLIHNYDTAGLPVNYIIVYAISANFKKLWDGYVKYMKDLNNKPNFIDKHRLLSFNETEKSNVAGIKIGLALHERDGKKIKVYHMFIDMYSKENDS